MRSFNMKKLIAAALAASMLITTPAFAEHRSRDRDYSHQERRKGGCGWLCGAIIGGVVVGALSSDRRERREREYDNRYYPPDHRIDRRYCVREQITEWYRGERYVYWETRCN
jgi:hypothetical protein